METLHIYTRVSSQVQKDEGGSLDTQLEYGINFSKNLNMDYKHWNEDVMSSKSEYIEDREVLDSLLKEVDRGKVKKLFVFEMDRLSRNEYVTLDIKKRLVNQKVTLFTRNGEYKLWENEDELKYNLVQLISQYENKKRRDRSRIGKLRVVKEGKWRGGPLTFGYRSVGGKVVIDPYESKFVKLMYELYDKGRSTLDIKVELEINGVPTRRNNKFWSLGSITKILQNTFYKGYYIFKDKMSEEEVVVPTPKIIDKFLWDSVNKKMKRVIERRQQEKNTKRFYLLRDKLICSCGNIMSGRQKQTVDGKINNSSYFCNKRINKKFKRNLITDKWKRGKGCSNIKSIHIGKTDELVWNNVLKVVEESFILKEKEKRKILDKVYESRRLKEESDVKHHEKIKRLEKQLGHIKETIKRVKTDLYLDPKNEELNEIHNNFNEQKTQLVREINLHKTTYGEKYIEDKWVDWLKEFKSELMKRNQLSDEEKRDYLDTLIEKIVVIPNENNLHDLEIQFKIPIINDKRIIVDKEGVKRSWKIKNGTDKLLLESCSLFGRQYLKKKVQIQVKDESVIKDMTETMGGLSVPSIPNHSVTVE
ncbi:MAG: hypothetical protein CBC25_01845 [Pelagibacteraceae bacterium TMED65]|nr:hypothetical protein [Rickettsiales bacterium]OUU52858.1 MAG: hypothetical protein CBC25_01845 [Pelagibacteraceae bacterium TMED65]